MAQTMADRLGQLYMTNCRVDLALQQQLLLYELCLLESTVIILRAHC